MRHRTLALLCILLWIPSACAPAQRLVDQIRPLSYERAQDRSTMSDPEPEAPTPMEVPPGEKGDRATWEAAVSETARRIVISREERRLWLMEGDAVLLTAPVAVGRDEVFRYDGREWDFSTPTGVRTVLDKEENPLWVPPDWHYFEKAVADDLEAVQLAKNERVELSDGTAIDVRDGEVGRINQFGNWWPFTPGSMIIFDGKVFIPPIGSPQREIPKVLGTHRLMIGDGYLIHGTPEVDSIGEWASHGCVRMRNREVETLYGMVDAGTKVYIY